MHGGHTLARCSRLPHVIAHMADCVLTLGPEGLPFLTKDGFLAEAKERHKYTRSHSQLCADYINQFWLELDGRFPNARVWLYDENDDDGRHIIISDMKNGYPPDNRSA